MIMFGILAFWPTSQEPDCGVDEYLKYCTYIKSLSNK